MPISRGFLKVMFADKAVVVGPAKVETKTPAKPASATSTAGTPAKVIIVES